MLGRGIWYRWYVEWNNPVPSGTEGKEQVLRVRRELILV
jgi:hypothetical protein